MALSDPINVRLGAERRQRTLAKLAQQMAARAGGRAQGAGQNFRSAAALRAAASPTLRLPFALPNNRMRPQGFDPQPDTGIQWGPPQQPAVLSQGGGYAGGGTAVAETPIGYASQTTPYTPSESFALQSPLNQPGPSGWTPTQSSMLGSSPGASLAEIIPGYGTQSDAPLEQPMASGVNYPDPWTVMMNYLRVAGAGRHFGG